ncbi:MAG: transposase [Bacteroidales bacterium]
MKPIDFFSDPSSIAQKQYEALRKYYLEGIDAATVAAQFGYTRRGFTTIASGFTKKIKAGKSKDLFFLENRKGRKTAQNTLTAKDVIISLRKKNCSVEDIKVALDSKQMGVSEKTIYNIIANEGFSKLPRRTRQEKQQKGFPQIQAEKSVALSFANEGFKSSSAGILCLLPYINKYGLDKIIAQSNYPQTSTLNRLSSILGFVALKASNVRRYSIDDLWCMDRGQGLFAGLNVLPKAAWFTSYSDRVTPDMNMSFLKALHKVWSGTGILGDTANLDFTTIPYWGDSSHLENNWSGKRTKALASMLAVLAQDPDSGIIDYGQTNVQHSNESEVVLEFLDFYQQGTTPGQKLNYLVFDSKFTNYENLNELNKKEVKFITIRRRGKTIVEKINSQPASKWKNIRVEASGNKKRTLKVYEEQVALQGYEGTIRQIVITGNGKIKPAIIITNDFDLPLEKIVRKYAKRWIVEKTISEQISFFHLNNVCSSMVIKVDFDLTMSILTYNIFKLMAMDLDRYEKLSPQSMYEMFLDNAADIEINDEEIIVALKKKRNLPLLLEKMSGFSNAKFDWLGQKKLIFKGASYS